VIAWPERAGIRAASRVRTYSVDYSVLEQALAHAASPLSSAEIHGGLCGVLCAARGSGDAWIAQCLAECEPGIIEAEGIAEMLETLKQETWAALSGTELEFAPFLPDDDSAIDERIEAIAVWCHGFLAGLAIGGFRPENVPAAERADVIEVVQDFAEIARAAVPRDDEAVRFEAADDEHDDDDDDEGEDDAASLMELTEFVRVSVQLVFEYLDGPAADSASATIH
jgi:uncharacterized protein